MVPYRGRISFRTYNPAKRTKYGILVRMLCESETGYICNFEIYSSEGKKLHETLLSVLEPYLDSWHHVYQDNCYNSISTAEILLEKASLWYHRGKPWLAKGTKRKVKDSSERGNDVFYGKDPLFLSHGKIQNNSQ